MLKSFFKLILGYGIINVFQKLLDYCSVLIFISYFTAKEYGIISLNTTILLSLTSIFSLSIEGAISRYYYRYADKSNFKEYLGSISLYVIIISFISGGLWILFSEKLFGFFLSDLPFSPYIQFAIIIAALDPINRLYLAYLVVKREIKVYAWYYNTYILLKLILLLVSTIFLKSIFMYFSAYLVAIILILPITLYQLSKVCRFNLRFTYIKEAISYSIYIIPVVLLNIINSLVGRGIILNKLGLDEVGIFSAALNIGNIILLLGTMINMSYMSFFMQKYEQSKENFVGEVRILGEIYLFIIIFSAVAMSLLSPIFTKFLPDSYKNAGILIPIFAFSGVSQIYYKYATNYISLEESLMKFKILGMFVGLIINYGIAYLFIGSYGIYSVAIASFFGYYVSACILEIIAKRIGNFDIRSRYKFFILLVSVFIPLITYFFKGFSILFIIIFSILILFIFILISDRFFFSNKFLSLNLSLYVKNNIFNK